MGSCTRNAGRASRRSNELRPIQRTAVSSFLFSGAQAARACARTPPCALLPLPPHHSLARGARARVAPARSSCWRGDGIIPRRKEADGRSELTLCGETRTCTIYLPEGGRILLLLLLSPRRARALAQYLPHPTVLPTRAHLCSGNRASKRVQSHSADHMSGCLAVPMAKAVLNSADTRALLPNDATRPVIVAPKAEQTVPPPRAPLLCLPRHQLLGISIVGARGATPDPRHRGKRRGKQRRNAASLRCRPLAKRSPSMEPMTYDYNICYSRPATD